MLVRVLRGNRFYGEFVQVQQGLCPNKAIRQLKRVGTTVVRGDDSIEKWAKCGNWQSNTDEDPLCQLVERNADITDCRFSASIRSMTTQSETQNSVDQPT